MAIFIIVITRLGDHCRIFGLGEAVRRGSHYFKKSNFPSILLLVVFNLHYRFFNKLLKNNYLTIFNLASRRVEVRVSRIFIVGLRV